MNTPVLILAYRRSDLLREILGVLPTDRSIYIHIDGPKVDTFLDVEECRKVAQDYANQSIKGSVQILAQSVNLGNRGSFHASFEWIFSVEDRVIVLEDDIRFSPDFFAFMDWALSKFENQHRVFHINGISMIDFLPGRNGLYESYSLKPWGFGTWKSRWDKYLQINQNVPTKSLDFLTIFDNVNLTQSFKDKWNDRLRRIDDDLDTYDVGWNYCAWSYNSIAISPRFTFTTNIGFDSRALHTKIKPLILRRPEKIKERRYDFDSVEVTPFPSFYDAYSDFLEWKVPGINQGSVRVFIFIYKVLVKLKRLVIRKKF